MYVRLFEFSFYSSIRGGEGAGVGGGGLGTYWRPVETF